MSTSQTQTELAPYLQAWQNFLPDRAGEPAWLGTLRRNAFEQFEQQGIPDRTQEDWRFFPLNALRTTAFARPLPPALPSLQQMLQNHPLANQPGPLLVFCNGTFVPALSRLESMAAGIRVQNISTLLTDSPELLQPWLAQQNERQAGPFAALNTAFMEDGAALVLEKNCRLQQPVTVLFISQTLHQSSFTTPRLLVAAGENSQAALVEVFLSEGEQTAFTCSATEFALAAGAQIDHVRIAQENLQTIHISSTRAELQGNSRFASHNMALGGMLTRNDITVGLRGSGIHATLNGLYLAGGNSVIDNHTAIDHAMPHCESHELYRGILYGRAQGVFNGKIFVQLDAQKTDAKQTNQALLLSKDARLNTKPQLEIFADDVKCTHGATVGQLSRESLFYLRSRGIGEEEARAMLVQAFAADVTGRIPLETVSNYLQQMLPLRF